MRVCDSCGGGPDKPLSKCKDLLVTEAFVYTSTVGQPAQGYTKVVLEPKEHEYTWREHKTPELCEACRRDYYKLIQDPVLLLSDNNYYKRLVDESRRDG